MIFRFSALAAAACAAATACDDGAASRFATEPSAPGQVADAPVEPTWPALNEELLAASAATMRFRLGTPAPLAITADGAVIYRRTGPRERVADLYQLGPSAPAAELLASATELLAGGGETLSDAEKARRERTRTSTRGFVDISVSADGRRVLAPLGQRLFVLERGAQAANVPRVRELAAGTGYPFDPQLSPDGNRVVWNQDGDLWLQDLAGGKARRLTQHPPELEYGVAEFVAQEELERRRGTWWSPDSKLLAFQRTDLRPVDTLYVADARNPDKPPVPFRYPRAGRPNAKVDLGLVPVTGGAPRWVSWDLARYPYLVHVEWPAGAPLTLLVASRDQTEVAALAVDLATGKTRELVRERDDTWLNAPPDLLTWLPDGSGFLWRTEAKGAWSLEHHDATGRHLRTIVTGDLGLRQVCGLSADGKDVIVEAAADPREQHVWRVPLAGGDRYTLTSGGGVHHATCKHGTIVLRSQLRDGGTRHEVLRPDGSRAELPTVAERPPLVPTTVLTSVGVEGRLQYVAITRPRAFDAKRKYPVLLYVYGGPHAKVVLDARDEYIMDQWYADAGFIVVRTDGRGTPDRGRDWERAISRDLVTVPMADQLGALRKLGASFPELDLARVGAFGWSFGGYMSAMAVLLHPEVFAAAVAGAPVTDWELYDTAYTERYMKEPKDNAEGYRRTSALTYADRLSRPLLLIHGITDDNVHFAHSLALIEALYVAGKRAEVVTLSATHMVPEPKLVLAREKVQVDFFRQHLAKPHPEIAARLAAERRAAEAERQRKFGADAAGVPAPAQR